ncbi:MAG: cation:proton antiporter [Parachlamydiales bacterium]
MYAFDIFTVLLVLSGIFSYLNSRLFHLPPTIGFMLGSLALSLMLLGFRAAGADWAAALILQLQNIDFGNAVLYGMLSFLLFAGSMQLELHEVLKQKWIILTLSTVGVVISTFVIGTGIHWVMGLIGMHIPYLYALGFGALISPTDPVIVIGMLKGSHAPKSLQVKVMGEALFNDGISIVLFVILFALAGFGAQIDLTDISLLIFQQLIGSAALGLLMGYIGHLLVQKIDSYTALIFITLGLVAFSYDLAILLGTSGPITVVVLGLFFRNYKWDRRPEESPLRQLPVFWTLLDEFLNAALFVMMGLEILKLRFTPLFAAIGGIAIVVTLFGRWISVWIPVAIFRHFRPFTRRVVTFLTWGGLRGGISLALALTLPPAPASKALLAATYMVVLFSTVVQGLTFRQIIGRAA